MSNPFSAYHESKLLSASPLQLVHLAYEGAIKAVTDAQTWQAPEHLQRRKAAITKAQLIIGELRRMLDFTAGGDIAVQLARLYDYMHAELRKAVYALSSNSLEHVKTLLTTLDEAWSQISLESHPIPVAPDHHTYSQPDSWSEEIEFATGRNCYSF